jgi:polysaccharide export outer membrane protein
MTVLATSSGCFAPLHYCGTPACELPESFRAPLRTGGPPVILASLTTTAPVDYILGANDTLEVTVDGLDSKTENRTLRVQVAGNGEVNLPLIGAIRLGGLTLHQAQAAVTGAYRRGFIEKPRVGIVLVQPSSVGIVVLGEVHSPGAYRLPKYENDVAHALAVARGLTSEAASYIEIHRRLAPEETHPGLIDNSGANGPPGSIPLPPPPLPMEMRQPMEEVPPPGMLAAAPMRIIKIPVRGCAREPISVDDVTLRPGDVVMVPKRIHETFYVVGKLSQANFIRFSLGVPERELGSGLLLPPDREIDVVTAVAMAGYIDPIDSPTTVTVHRTRPDGTPLLVIVDLIKARYDRQETILVQPGDIIYLNPDCAWWSRRTFDRIIPSLFSFGVRYSIPNGGSGGNGFP